MGRARRCRDLEHVEAHIGGDAVEPGTGAGAPLEAVAGPPGTHHGLLDGVVGVEPGPEHAVAVGGQLPPECLQVVRSEEVVADCHSPVYSCRT